MKVWETFENHRYLSFGAEEADSWAEDSACHVNAHTQIGYYYYSGKKSSAPKARLQM